MRLTILNVSYSMASVSSGSAGGAEQVLWQIDRALCQRGHRSLVVAPQGSSISGELLATSTQRGALERSGPRVEYTNHRKAIENALAREPIDLIHLHGVDFYEYLPDRLDIPILVTLHLPPSWYPSHIFNAKRPNLYFHGVSPSQQKEIPATATQLLPVIENGVALDEFTLKGKNGGYVVSIGRICPEKGFHLAIDAAKLATVPMVLAGQTFPYPLHLQYFKREIAPRLDRKHPFIGPVDLHKKRKLLAGAACLLAPSLCPETSSLVAMEASAAGTPVVAYAAGALPDIVEDGHTGFIVGDVAEMAAAIGQARKLDREECRRVAKERFSLQSMIDSYIATYNLLTRKGGHA